MELAVLIVTYICYSAINSVNGEANKLQNQITGEWSGTPDTARQYKVAFTNMSIVL